MSTLLKENISIFVNAIPATKANIKSTYEPVLLYTNNHFVGMGYLGVHKNMVVGRLSSKDTILTGDDCTLIYGIEYFIPLTEACNTIVDSLNLDNNDKKGDNPKIEG